MLYCILNLFLHSSKAAKFRVRHLRLTHEISVSDSDNKGSWDAAWENHNHSWINVTEVGTLTKSFSEIFFFLSYCVIQCLSFLVSISVPGNYLFILLRIYALKLLVKNISISSLCDFWMHPEAATGELFSLRLTKRTVKMSRQGQVCTLPIFSDESCAVDPALVPSVCRAAGDETQVHVEHLPVHRICRRARSDQGEVLQF